MAISTTPAMSLDSQTSVSNLCKCCLFRTAIYVEHSKGQTWHRVIAVSWNSNLVPVDVRSRTSLKRESSVCPSETSARILMTRLSG